MVLGTTLNCRKPPAMVITHGYHTISWLFPRMIITPPAMVITPSHVWFGCVYHPRKWFQASHSMIVDHIFTVPDSYSPIICLEAWPQCLNQALWERRYLAGDQKPQKREAERERYREGFHMYILYIIYLYYTAWHYFIYNVVQRQKCQHGWGKMCPSLLPKLVLECFRSRVSVGFVDGRYIDYLLVI